MHDFMLAKEVVDEVMKIVKSEKISQVRKVSIEIGQIALAHDGYEKHVEDISLENLKFGLDNLVKGTMLEKTNFKLKKVKGGHWHLTEIEGE